jgi:hypothetical protein
MTAKVAKIADPEAFDGTDRTKLPDFRAQLALKFRIQAADYPNDATKIACAVSYLKGATFKWVKPHIRETDGSLPDYPTYNDFLEALNKAFDDPNRRATAERELENLRQGKRSASLYYADFMRLMADLNYDENAQMSHFRRGLRIEVKNLMMSRDVPKTFDELTNLAITLDNNFVSQQMETTGRRPFIPNTPWTKTTNTPRPLGTSTGTAPGPMELGSTERKKLTQEQRNY